jgi:hypothetical protein
MSDDILYPVLILSAAVAVVVLPLMLLRLMRRARRAKEQKSRSEQRARFEHRQLHPDYDAFKKRYGNDPPRALRQLIEDCKSMLDSNFDLVFPPSRRTWFVAWFEPMDEEHMSLAWRGAEGFYSFANDGCDNQYLVSPQEDDPEVWFYSHETRKRKALGVRVSQFLAAERKRNDDM